jgi:hypothetical protein
VIAATGFLLLLAASAVEVQSTTDCPSSAEVSERLRPLLPPAREAAEAAHLAQIDVGEAPADQVADLRLRLLRADGHVIGDRRVPAQATCQETADAVAAIIAAWETTSPPALAIKESATGNVVTAATPAPVVTPPLPFQLHAGAAAGAALIGGMAGSGSLELLFGRAMSRWQLRLAAATESARRIELGPGQVDWQHTGFVAGVAVRTRHPVWLLAFDAGPSLGWATLQGSNFWKTYPRQRSFEWGADGGLRAGRWFGRLAVWAEARAAVWALGQRARLGGSSDTADLPLVDVALRLGLSARVF